MSTYSIPRVQHLCHKVCKKRIFLQFLLRLRRKWQFPMVSPFLFLYRRAGFSHENLWSRTMKTIHLSSRLGKRALCDNVPWIAGAIVRCWLASVIFIRGVFLFVTLLWHHCWKDKCIVLRDEYLSVMSRSSTKYRTSSWFEFLRFLIERNIRFDCSRECTFILINKKGQRDFQWVYVSKMLCLKTIN